MNEAGPPGVRGNGREGSSGLPTTALPAGAQLDPTTRAPLRAAHFSPAKEFQTSLWRVEMIPQTSDKNAGTIWGREGGRRRVRPAAARRAHPGRSGPSCRRGHCRGAPGPGRTAGGGTGRWGFPQQLSSAGMSPSSWSFPCSRHGGGQAFTRSSSKDMHSSPLPPPAPSNITHPNPLETQTSGSRSRPSTMPAAGIRVPHCIRIAGVCGSRSQPVLKP